MIIFLKKKLQGMKAPPLKSGDWMMLLFVLERPGPSIGEL
jgi:hypothetical protein